MTPSDEELLSFDRSRLADWDERRASIALALAPDLYRNHLMIAKWIDGWVERLEESGTGTGESDEDFVQDFVQALREIAAHLRQADFVPGGGLYDEIAGPGPGRHEVPRSRPGE